MSDSSPSVISAPGSVPAATSSCTTQNVHGGKEVGAAPRLNRESCPGNSCLREVLVLVMGPVSQPRRSLLLVSTGNTDGGCGVTVQNGPHLSGISA